MNELSIRSIVRPSRSSDTPSNSVSVTFSDRIRFVIVPAMRYGVIVDGIHEIQVKEGQDLIAQVSFPNGEAVAAAGSRLDILESLPQYVRAIGSDIHTWMQTRDFKFTKEVIDKLLTLYQVA